MSVKERSGWETAVQSEQEVGQRFFMWFARICPEEACTGKTVHVKLLSNSAMHHPAENDHRCNGDQSFAV